MLKIWFLFFPSTLTPTISSSRGGGQGMKSRDALVGGRSQTPFPMALPSAPPSTCCGLPMAGEQSHWEEVSASFPFQPVVSSFFLLLSSWFPEESHVCHGQGQKAPFQQKGSVWFSQVQTASHRLSMQIYFILLGGWKSKINKKKPKWTMRRYKISLKNFLCFEESPSPTVPEFSVALSNFQ